MDPNLEGLEPVLLWKHFDELLRIPHCSKHEDAVRMYVIGVAERFGLQHIQDAAGNVLDDIMGKTGLMSDRIHPNAKGYEVMASTFEKAIRPYL